MSLAWLHFVWAYGHVPQKVIQGAVATCGCMAKRHSFDPRSWSESVISLYACPRNCGTGIKNARKCHKWDDEYVRNSIAGASQIITNDVSTSTVSYLKSRYIRMTQGTPTSQTEPKLKGVQGFFCVDTFGLQKVWCLPQCLDSPFDRPAPRFNGAASVAISCQIKKGNDTTTKYYSWKIRLELIYSCQKF